MVCIIDDREDVWRHASNLIHVRPYSFFQSTGDINAPPPLRKYNITIYNIIKLKSSLIINTKKIECTNLCNFYCSIMYIYVFSFIIYVISTIKDIDVKFGMVVGNNCNLWNLNMFLFKFGKRKAGSSKFQNSITIIYTDMWCINIECINILKSILMTDFWILKKKMPSTDTNSDTNI